MFDYEILVRDTDVELRQAVYEARSHGYKPQGGVAVGYREEMVPIEPTMTVGSRAWQMPPTRHRMYWVQAMIREGEQK